ncbi:MAG: hypothetical protein ACYCY5_12510, partial [Sulfuricella sp.]
MQDAGRAAWPFHASDRQRRSAPASAARMFELFMDSPLIVPIKASKAIQAKLDKLGLFTAHDLLLHLPLRYQDETRIYPIAHA